MAQIGISQKETFTASQPASQGSQPNKTPNTTSQPANQPAKQNQPARQPNTNLVGESNAKNLVLKKVIPKTNVSVKNNPNWYYSKGNIYRQPAKVASQTKHQTQPASQPTSQPNKQNQPARQPNTDLVGESNAKNLVSGRK